MVVLNKWFDEVVYVCQLLSASERLVADDNKYI